jgi:hypothetical protein
MFGRLGGGAPRAAPAGEPGGRHAADGTLGITYVLEGVGQTIFGSDIYSIDVGMPKDPVIMLEGVFEGGVLINKEDFIAAAIAAVLVAALTLFFQKTHRPGPARGGGRPPGGVVGGHPAQRSGSSCGAWPAWWRWWPASSGAPSWACSSRCHRGLARAAGGDSRWPDLGARARSSAASSSASARSCPRSISALRRRRHRDLVRLHAGPGVPAVPAAGPVRREDH